MAAQVIAQAASCRRFGWAFLHVGPSNDGWVFYSSEAEAVDWRPKLQVTYSHSCLGHIVGPCGSPDGVVGPTDFLVLLANWGACP